MDGFALRAADTFGASEAAPVRLDLGAETIPTGSHRRARCASAWRSRSPPVAVPRGADAVLPVEDTDVEGASVIVRRAVVPVRPSPSRVRTSGAARACCSRARVSARARRACSPRSDATRSSWCAGRASRSSRRATRSCSRAGPCAGSRLRQQWPHPRGRRERARRRARFSRRLPRRRGHAAGGAREGDRERRSRAALGRHLEGGRRFVQSRRRRARAGDRGARRGAEARQTHLSGGRGTQTRGDPARLTTSAVFTFHQRRARDPRASSVRATLAQRTVSSAGVSSTCSSGSCEEDGGLAAYPMGKGSGSVTAFSRADGFVRIGAQRRDIVAFFSVRPSTSRTWRGGGDIAISSWWAKRARGARCDRERALARRAARQAARGGLARGSPRRAAASATPPPSICSIPRRTPTTRRSSTRRCVCCGATRAAGRRDARHETRPLDELLADPALRMVNRNRGSGTRGADRRQRPRRTARLRLRARTSPWRRPWPSGAPIGRDRRSNCRAGAGLRFPAARPRI